MSIQAQAEHEVLAILADLVAIDSTYPPGDTSRIAAYLHGRLARAGYASTIVRAGKVDNVVARMKGAAPGPSIVFNAHVDTVGPGERSAWRTDPFEATLVDGRVYGLGAGNAKGAAAAQVWVAEAIADNGGIARGELVFTFVGDEENLGPDGLAALRRDGVVKPDLLVVGAQTENQLIVAERGVLWTKVVTRGRAAHAGAMHLGDSAILRMSRVIQAIETGLAPRIAARVHASLGGRMQSMINIGKIRGGENTNVVPDRCEIEIDRRLLPGESVDAAFAELRDVVLAAGEPDGTIDIDKLTGTNGFEGRSDGAGVRALLEAILEHTGRPAGFLNVVGVFDGRYFADDGIEIIDFGPGEGHEGHAPNESVPLGQVAVAAHVQFAAVERMLGKAR